MATGIRSGARKALACALGLAFVAILASRAAAADPPAIAAASDLKFALEEAAAAFTAADGRKLRLAFGSSGNFARQIEQGGPFEMFLSADEDFVFRLADKGLTLDRGDLYAVGRIALIAPHGSALKVDGALADLRAAVADGRIKRFAIANPEHAPYGRAAEQALRHVGLWDALRPALVLGENVSQAAQFATSGSAQGGIIAYALALAPAVGKLGTYALLPADWHQPLNQRMVLTAGAGDTARMFHAFMRTKPARAILARHGFVLPGESS
jgi:molybdate transport system substrate-binding protein